MRTSLGIWALGSMVTRFVPGGYQPERAAETTAQRVRRAVDGLGDLIDDYEFHYPGELSHENLDEVRGALLGAVLIGTLQNGLNTANVSNGWIYIITGLVLLSAVMLDTFAVRLQARSGR